MSSHIEQGIERESLLERRREGGIWLRSLRERAGLSQRDLATAVGADYYSFISQLEAGRGRVPVAQVEAWARALKVPRAEFARGMLKFYDPITHDMLFGDEPAEARAAGAPEPVQPPAAGAPAPEVSAAEARGAEVHILPTARAIESDADLRARITRLEAILMLRGSGL